MTVRAVALAAAGGILALVAAGCRGERDSGGAAGQGDDMARDAAAPEPRKPETAVLTAVAIHRVDPARPRPISDEDLSARLGRVLTASPAFAADEAKVRPGRVGVAAEVAVTVRYDVVEEPAGEKPGGKAGGTKRGKRAGTRRGKVGGVLSVMVGIEARVDWKASGERLEPHENVLIERPVERRAERELDPIVVELVTQAVELAGRGLVEKETLRQGDDGAVMAALASDDADAVLWGLELCADRRLAGSFDRAVALLDHADPGVRAAALRVLVALRDPRAVQPLARRADFADPDTMRALVEAVTAIGGPEAIEFLELVAGGHAEPDMRERAREGLERLGRRQRPNP
ncbi:MAG TPA: HEAT repeat domain-containing protein [Kofleriaceae bacterium]|nr:HEAT repeat domain-containing protein [Kofleriaceae bacterium]